MQNIWLNDKAYSLSWQGNIKYLQSLRDMVAKDNIAQDVPLDIQPDRPVQQGQKLVISNEGFSSAFLNQRKNQIKIPSFIEYTSRNLGKLANRTSNLLIIVREPISWIKSTYIQSVKEGGRGSAQNFVDKQIQFLKHSMNMEYIVSCYRRYFKNLLIVPYELLKSNEDLFWNQISETFQVPVVKTRIKENLNPSLDLKRLFILSKLNETSNMLLGTLIQSSSYSNIQEKQYLASTYLNTGKWVHRRFVEHASHEQIDDLYGLLNIQEPDENFLHFTLPSELVEVIQLKYIDSLKNHIAPDYTDYYEKRFHEYSTRA